MKRNQTSADAEDQSPPKSTDLGKFTSRLEDQQEDLTKRPTSDDDDAWYWFLSLFSDRGDVQDQPGDDPSRRAA